MGKVAIGILALLLPSLAVAAEPQYLVQAEGLSNSLGIGIAGDANLLVIFQDHFGGLAENALSVSIIGDRNGGPSGRTFAPSLTGPGLTPGTLVQAGSGNTMAVEIEGSDNLFGFAQIGTGNSLTASVSGTYNQAVVYQSGDGNTVGFSQNGIGNMLLISQRSW